MPLIILRWAAVGSVTPGNESHTWRCATGPFGDLMLQGAARSRSSYGAQNHAGRTRFHWLPLSLSVEDKSCALFKGVSAGKGCDLAISWRILYRNRNRRSEGQNINIAEIKETNLGLMSGRPRRASSEAQQPLHYMNTQEANGLLRNLLKINKIPSSGPQFLRLSMWGQRNVETHSGKRKAPLQLCLRARRSPCWTAVCWPSPGDLRKERTCRSKSHSPARNDMGARSPKLNPSWGETLGSKIPRGKSSEATLHAIGGQQ